MIRFSDQNQTEIEATAIPKEVSIIPLRNACIFPGILLPIFVGRIESIRVIEEDSHPGTLIGLFTQRYSDAQKITKKTIYHTGTLAEIHRVTRMGDSGFQVMVQGIQKIKLEKIISYKPYIQASISILKEIQDSTEKLNREFQKNVIKYIKENPNLPDEISAFVRHLDNPSSLANQIVFFSQKSISERMKFLEIKSISQKIQFLNRDLMEEINRLHMEKEVHQKVEEDTSRMQKEFYLRKQLETIRKELGDSDDDINELKLQLDEKWLPDAIRDSVHKKFKRLERSLDGSSHGSNMETNQIRNWLELILELPWEEPPQSDISLLKAKAILDHDHEGLEEIKRRILDHLVVEKQNGSGRAPILCLIGPPGVGKTSLATSIARSLDRPLVRAALGGLRDEAEIRGHRLTYIGAMPGKIVNSMKKAKMRNPVFLLDEIDKLNDAYSRSPSSALLEVLDPEQNNTFEDYYLGEPYDLSRVFFICTANHSDSIPQPLLDRMEVIQLSGYTLAEKRSIAKKHLLPRVMRELGLAKGQITLSANALQKIIMNHTRESGVRELKRKLEQLTRTTLRIALEESEKSQKTKPKTKLQLPKFHYDTNDIQRLLGRDRYFQDYKENITQPGVATALAWTPTGGEILFVEATAYKGKDELKLSGQLGDIMKESAYTALSFLRAHSKELKIDTAQFTKQDIHIHIPSGSIPKDGPSAGVTLLAALASLFIKKAVAKNLAMTGEISLRGKILPVGGIKEKVLAAKAAGIHKIFLPAKNRPDFEDIPKHVAKGLEVEYHNDMLKLLAAAIGERTTAER